MDLFFVVQDGIVCWRCVPPAARDAGMVARLEGGEGLVCEECARADEATQEDLEAFLADLRGWVAGEGPEPDPYG